MPRRWGLFSNEGNLVWHKYLNCTLISCSISLLMSGRMPQYSMRLMFRHANTFPWWFWRLLCLFQGLRERWRPVYWKYSYSLLIRKVQKSLETPCLLFLVPWEFGTRMDQGNLFWVWSQLLTMDLVYDIKNDADAIEKTFIPVWFFIVISVRRCTHHPFLLLLSAYILRILSSEYIYIGLYSKWWFFCFRSKNITAHLRMNTITYYNVCVGSSLCTSAGVIS